MSDMSQDKNKPDSIAGFDRAPDRYTAQTRETIDRQRDLAYKYSDILAGVLSVRPESCHFLANSFFNYLCECQVMRYEDRQGHKGGDEGAQADEAKRLWYKQMAEHVLGLGPDPRAGRPGFQSYTRKQ